MIRKIFVPLEISAQDDVVIRYAVELARKFEAKLVFFKTYLASEFAYPTSGMASIVPESNTLVLEEEEMRDAKLKFLKDNYPRLAELDYELVILPGTPVDLLTQAANEKKSDLILIGTTGASGFAELFGTMAESLSREASCPVLVIPDEFAYRGMNKISLALDTDNVENGLHLDTLFDITKRFAASLDIVNVSENIDEADLHHNMIYSRIKKELKANVNYFSIRILLKDNEEKALEEYVDKNHVDMLALVYRDHGFFKRMFNPGLRKKMVYHTKIPLLVLK
ncbi:MAG: universal stress protein [Cyclobacteriaceae bacterium]|nr:universal stress protein [Cyclobacteriaceae bacterium]